MAQDAYCFQDMYFRIFADDTNVYYSSDNPKQLESIMNEEIKLSLNIVLETNYIFSGTVRKRYCDSSNYTTEKGKRIITGFTCSVARLLHNNRASYNAFTANNICVYIVRLPFY